jgi:CRISPR-associated exonuclease Cas4
VRIARGLRLRSLRLGLTGIADVIEFHKEEVICGKCLVASETPYNSTISLPGVSGLWRPFIVEYKRGRLRHEKSFEVQLCAQALCLEEMLNVHVPEGAVFYGKPRRRLDVAFTPGLRTETEIAAARLHELFNSGRTPPAVYEKKCESCSLMPVCMPKTMNGRRIVDKYIKDNIQT